MKGNTKHSRLRNVPRRCSHLRQLVRAAVGVSHDVHLVFGHRGTVLIPVPLPERVRAVEEVERPVPEARLTVRRPLWLRLRTKVAVLQQ